MASVKVESIVFGASLQQPQTGDEPWPLRAARQLRRFAVGDVRMTKEIS